MPNSTSSTGRMLDDDMPPPHPVSAAQWARPTAVPPPLEPRRLSSPEPIFALPLQPAQRACYEALGLALQEGHVFAAVTGPEGSGKTTVLEAVLADRHDRALRCIRISDPDKVPPRLAAQIEQVAYAEAGKPENLERHVVLAIDDAHTASDDLLRCLARLAGMREPGRRVPQVLLVGRPELWGRLASDEYAPLARRMAIRAVLPTLEAEEDPWASLEQEVSQTMSQLRTEGEHLPAVPPEPSKAPLFERSYVSDAYPLHDAYPTVQDEAGLPLDPETVPPPTDFVLFPDPPPRPAPARPREHRRRLLLPLGCMMAALAAFAFMLSFYDWPDLFDDLPWADAKPATPFAFNQLASGNGLPPIAGWLRPGEGPARKTSDPAATSDPTTSSHAAIAPAAAPASSDPKPPEPEPAAKPIDAAAAPPPLAEATKPIVAPPAEQLSNPPAPTPMPTPLGQASGTSAEPMPATAPAATPVSEPPVVVAALVAPIPPHPIHTAPIPVVKPAPLPPSIVTLLLRRGDEQLAIGDVSAARLLFERAAEAGNAQGAFRLARTYDPAFLRAVDLPSLADRGAARVWYGRAASLGDHEAAARLKELHEGR